MGVFSISSSINLSKHGLYCKLLQFHLATDIYFPFIFLWADIKTANWWDEICKGINFRWEIYSSSIALYKACLYIEGIGLI